MYIFILLTLAHFVGDYLLQTNWIYHQKTLSFGGGFWHASTMLLAYLIVMLPWLADWRIVTGLILMAIAHWFQDWGKVKYMDNHIDINPRDYYLDQFLHVLTAAVLGFVIQGIGPTAFAGQWVSLWLHPDWNLFLIALVLVTYFWDTTAYIQGRPKKTDKLIRNWKGMAIRGAIVCGVFLLYLAI